MSHRLSLCSRAALISSVFALFTLSVTATAQTEAGIARDPSTHAPLACLHVSLVDSAGSVVGHTVTDSLGQFALDAPRAGLYRARFETWGWAPLDGPLDTLSDADFKQRAYPVAFTDVIRTVPLDSLPHKIIPWKKRHDRATFDSVYATPRRLSEEARRREESTGWKSRRLESQYLHLRYPEPLRLARAEVLPSCDSSSIPRAERGTVPGP